MLRKRNRRREGWGKSKKSDRTERTLTCMGGEMGEDKERRDRGGERTTDMQRRRRRKIKRRVRGGDRYTGFSRNEEGEESRTRMRRRREGIKQGISIFA